jgi:hypothetical protein
LILPQTNERLGATQIVERSANPQCRDRTVKRLFGTGRSSREPTGCDGYDRLEFLRLEQE